MNRDALVRAALAAAISMGSMSGPAHAQTAPSADWQYELTPYLWATGMKGDVQARSLPRTGIDTSFTDIVDVLDFALMGAFEARKHRWGFLFDGIYMKLSDSATARQTGPGPIGATLTATADVKVRQTMLAAAAAYRVSEGRSPVDVIGGLRYSKIDVSADVNASLFGPLGAGVAATVARSGDKDWVDPYVGVRIQHPIADRWTLVGYVDVGGFGVASDFTWQAIAGANYEYSKSVSLKFGYRYLSVDYDKSGFLYDMKIQGPYAAVGIRF